MLRKFVGAAVLGLAFCASAVLAGEIKGKCTKVDDADNKITLTVDGKDTEYTVATDCKMPKGRAPKGGGEAKTMTLKDLAKTVDRMKERGGMDLTVVTSKKDGKEVVTEIKTAGRGPGKKKEKE